ncbi:hypothetical protein [Arenibacterium halophilum]|uniref:Uncharacterized protein n=1 Tax=Arenibacterium halophilum TaxID=2583821 RepID=A0ABY2XDH1_9RHOB|nr:hypothetical protein [Arenibacterium halophilum]TMV15053.1 hypothetical protein FGK64_03540 [Arenibacterium halophilum]
MQISYGVPIVAPSVTGHPAALPPEPEVTTPDSRVAPVAGGASAQGAQTQTQSQSDDQTAPPSAMQRKIMEILERQAKEIEEE